MGTILSNFLFPVGHRPAARLAKDSINWLSELFTFAINYGPTTCVLPVGPKIVDCALYLFSPL